MCIKKAKTNEPVLGAKETVDALLFDLYIDLRNKVHYWSKYTNQTAQARMGYIGQHLVSAITGYKGGKSGARGYDLIIGDSHGEIKTCSKVDQLGLCKKCNAPVSSIESECSECGSNEIIRRDDSKWLIDIKSEEELDNTISPLVYYFVLFEFETIEKTNSDIVISVFKIDPKKPGFVLCMLDYYYTIRTQPHKNNPAPFNLWPNMFKFDLMEPTIVYRAKINTKNEIQTLIFNNPTEVIIKRLSDYSKTRSLTKDVLISLADQLHIPNPQSFSKEALATQIDVMLSVNQKTNHDLAVLLSRAIYLPRLEPHKSLIKDIYKNYLL